MITFLYQCFVHIYYFGIYLSSFFNKKAKDWIEGRKITTEQLGLNHEKLQHCIVVHCASVGEFEQARPLIEKIKEQEPKTKIILTFFSPSGYNFRKNYPKADGVFYLPFDFKQDVASFLQSLQPKAFIIIKYEFWYNLLEECYNRNIPVYLVSAIFRHNQIFFNPLLGAHFRLYLSKMKCIFLQNISSQQLLHQYNIKNTLLSGDTRYDRVLEIINQHKKFEAIEKIKAQRKCFIVGSAWLEDLQLLKKSYSVFNHYFFIVVPHEVSPENNQKIVQLFPDAVLHSKCADEDTSINTLIIDSVGLLSSLYAIADIAYVGGGFGKGIHNTLEPAVWGIPVLFGPKFDKFYEARELIENDLSKSIHNNISFEKAFTWAETLNKQAFQKKSAHFFNQRKGATETIYFVLKKHLYN